MAWMRRLGAWMYMRAAQINVVRSVILCGGTLPLAVESIGGTKLLPALAPYTWYAATLSYEVSRVRSWLGCTTSRCSALPCRPWIHCAPSSTAWPWADCSRRVGCELRSGHAAGSSWQDQSSEQYRGACLSKVRAARACTVHTRPPTRSRASSTSTCLPAASSARAAARPDRPAPTTTTSYTVVAMLSLLDQHEPAIGPMGCATLRSERSEEPAVESVALFQITCAQPAAREGAHTFCRGDMRARLD